MSETMAKDKLNNVKETNAKQRWAILRAAILTHDNDTPSSQKPTSTAPRFQAVSIHNFPGFQLLNRKILPKEETQKIIGGDNDKSPNDYYSKYEIVQYSIPIHVPHDSSCLSSDDTHSNGCSHSSSNNETKDESSEKNQPRILHIRTREKAKAKEPKVKIDLKALTSQRYYDGVDNTCNIRVWDCASTLTHVVTRSRAPSCDSAYSSCNVQIDLEGIFSLAVPVTASSREKKLRVVELGAGMAGIAGLTLSALFESSILPKRYNDIDVEVLITDGHPDGVANNKFCTYLTSSLHNKDTHNDCTANCKRSNVQVFPLLWKDSPQGASECAKLTENSNSCFQLCMVSDCLHFKEFHACLLATIGRLVDVNGICVLCQPKRGKSLEQFMDLVKAVNNRGNHMEEGFDDVGPLFECYLWEDYDDAVTNLHNEFMVRYRNDEEGGHIYEPTTHYPNLLVLKKLRPYHENEDTEIARNHVQQRG